MNINDCKGCYSSVKELGVIKCSVLHGMKRQPNLFTRFPMCPCVDCIVKMMCKILCQEFSEFSTNFYRRHKRRKIPYEYK